MNGKKCTSKVWTVTHTPFCSDGSLDVDALAQNAAILPTLGIAGTFFNSYMGECYSMSYAERMRAAEAVVAGGGCELQTAVAIEADSIPMIIEMGLHAKKIGASYAALVVPALGPRSPEQMTDFFAFIFSQVDMPFVLFNPQNRLAPETFSRLCELPNLRILKNPGTGPYADTLRATAKNGVVVSDPTEESYLENAGRHAQPILFADPEPMLYHKPGYTPITDYVRLFWQGDETQARALRDSLEPMHRVYNKWVIEPYYKGEMSVAAIKKILDLKGTLTGGYVREPLKPLSAQQERSLASDLEAAEML